MAAMFRLLVDDTCSDVASVQLVMCAATVLHAALRASAVNDGGDVLHSIVLPVWGYCHENRERVNRKYFQTNSKLKCYPCWLKK